MVRTAEFGNEFDSALARSEALGEVVGASRLQKSGLVLEAIEQLEPPLEELPVAGEKLRRQNRQNDELPTTRLEPDAGRQKYEELFEFAPDGHLVTDANGVIEEAKRLDMEVEERVRWRTAELNQEIELKDQLLIREQRARSNAEAANRSKDEFLAMVAHELRTPLNAILGWAHLMGSEIGNETQRARAGEVIERSALAQARIINDILDVSRIVTGNLLLDMRSLDFALAVRASIESARPAIDAKGIHLDTMLDEAIGEVIGDFSRLQQVVGNILSNSIKFTPAGGRISINLNRAGDVARLIVTDTGDGISPTFLPFVFDRFRQADGEMTRRQVGLGLGLAIVNHLVKMHCGTVEASSEGEGKGSTFTVSLPLAPDSQIEANISDTESHDLHARSERLEGLWVAVVDDDPDARELMRAVLEAEGARVTACGSSEDALALLSDKATAALTPRRPDVIVADTAMPGRDGFDLIRTLRRLEAARGGAMRAVALTGLAGEEARLRSLAAGYQEHLTKPVAMEELVTTIARLASSNS
jgi:signal transduction histidine kinase/CheY-like chemotaxis protein